MINRAFLTVIALAGMGVLPLLSHAVLVTLLGVLVEVLVML